MSASGVFSHSKAEAMLQQLLDTSKRHEKELSSLRKLCTFDEYDLKDGEGVLIHKLQTIEEKMSSLSDRLGIIEKSIEIPGGTSSLTVGEAAAANRKTLARALGIIATKADAEEVQTNAASQKKELDSATEQLKSDLADNIAVEKMNDAVAALSSRIEVLSNDVQNKVDNASFKLMASDANSIRSHASFVQRTDETIKKLEDELVSQKDRVGKQGEFADGVSNTVSCLEKEMKERATAKELISVMQKVDRLSSNMDGKASKDAVNKLLANFDGSAEKTATIEKELRALLSSHEGLSTHLGRQLNDVAVASEKRMETCVRSDQFHGALCDLRAEIAAKAWAQSVEELERSTMEFKTDFGVTKKKAELAAQFVAWYGNRGDSYEHNLQAVDAHLKTLASTGGIRR